VTRSLPAQLTVERAIGVIALALVALGPVIFSTYFVSVILTQTLFLGIVAASLIFLSAYGAMVSLAQISVFGIAGFVLGNVVTHGETKGLNLGWNPWLGVVLGLAIATAFAFVFGALASRSAGIYFLMITLTYAVIANLFFGQVTRFSGFGGISNIDSHTPSLIGSPDLHPNRIYYACLIVSVVGYAVMRYITRSPFGLALQGVRDDPVRMSSLGYNVPLHRTLAFGFAGFIAACAGVLFVWWNGHIDPASIDIGSAIDILVIAVIGGLFHLEGAWLGAFVFVVIQNYIRDIGLLKHSNFLSRVGLDSTRFHTYIGAVFLIIVLLSPGGLLGIGERLLGTGRRLYGGGRRGIEAPPRPGEPATTVGDEAREPARSP
jgi:branched-chain amino acid transport system permease protein